LVEGADQPVAGGTHGIIPFLAPFIDLSSFYYYEYLLGYGVIGVLFISSYIS
jgi:hypothetical protein